MILAYDGKINKGIAWAAAQIPGAVVSGDSVRIPGHELRLEAAPLPPSFGRWQANGPSMDDYEIHSKDDAFVVCAHTQAGMCFGLLDLAERLASGQPPSVRHDFPFNTRNYKHEMSFVENDRRKSLLDYSADFWEGFCRELLRHRFNGLVFYPGTGHPFQYVLDYDEFPGARAFAPEALTRNREALNLGLRIAREHGIRTFIQNYVLEYTPTLAAYFKLPFFKPGVTNVARGRMVNPEITAYWKYCFRRLFELCPDLTGLYMNYEGAGDAYGFIEETAIAAFNAMERKPILMHRIWTATVPENLAHAVRAYQGKSMFSHKITDSADSCIYPTADSRLTEWKRAVPGVEAMYLVGPCHNCNNNLDRVLWTDVDFIRTLLADAKKKGADSISFHTVADPLAYYIRTKGVIKEESENLGWLCYFYMMTVADFIAGRVPSDRELTAQHARHFGVDMPSARKLRALITESSRIVPLLHQQFYNCGSSEGWQIHGWKNFIQEPFFLRPYCYLNNLAHEDPWPPGSWLNKNVPSRVAPDDMQLIIDYVDPRRKKTKRNPGFVVKALRRYAARTSRKVLELAGSMDPARYQKLAWYVDANSRIALWNAEEMQAGIEFYSCYFAKDRAAFLRQFRKGLAHLRKGREQVKRGDERKEKVIRWSGHLLNWLSPYDIEGYIADAERALTVLEKAPFPFEVFREYVASRMAHNEIRRWLRPVVYHSPQSMARAAKLLRRSLKLGEKCLRSAQREPSAAPFVPCIEEWLGYLRYELQRLKIATVHAAPEGSKAAAEVPVLGTDHGFKYGDDFWHDFTSFFVPERYLPAENVSFSVRAGRRELVVHVTQKDCDPAELEKVWERILGTEGEYWFLRLYVDTQNRGKEAWLLAVAPKARYILKNRVIFKHRQHMTATLAEQVFDCGSRYETGPGQWTLRLRLPYAVLETTRPKRGDVWRLNVTTNVRMRRKGNCIWQAGFEGTQWGKPRMTGRLVF